MNISLDDYAIKEKNANCFNSPYPWCSAIMALIILLVSPFVSQMLMFAVFAIQIYRLVRYDIDVNCIDMAFLISFSGLYRAPGGDSLLALFVLLFDLRCLLRTQITNVYSTIMLMITSLYLAMRLGNRITTLVFVIGGLFFLWLLSNNRNIFRNVKILYSFIIGAAISSVYSWVFMNNNAITAIVGINEAESQIEIVGYSRFSGLFADPNYYSAILIFSLIGIMILRINQKIKPFWGYCIAIIIILIGLLTVSKSFFLMLVIILMYYTFSLFNQKHILAGIGMGLILGVGITLIFSGNLSIFDNILERFNQSSTNNELTSGRNLIWERYLEYVSGSASILLFGEGLDAPILGSGTHNIFLEAIYNIGIVGLFLMMMLLLFIYRTIRQDFPKRKQSILRFLPIIAMFLIYFFLQGITTIIFYMMLFIMFTCYVQCFIGSEK